MDAFFVSVELLRRPELRGRPVVVGGSGGRGVVAAASYEARAYGVHSAMPSVTARRRCPDAVFLDGDHALYRSVSGRVMEIFRSVTPLVEPLSLDEAFLDVSGAARLLGSPVAIAHRLREEIAAAEGLSCTVGVARTKFLAKLASQHAKPRPSRTGPVPGAGVLEVRPDDEEGFLGPLPAEAMWGVGPVTLEKLHRLGVTTIGEIAAIGPDTLRAALGDGVGAHLHALAIGADERRVVPDAAPKSISHEETFTRDLQDRHRVDTELTRLADAVAGRLREAGLVGRTVTVKVRDGEFRTVTRSRTLPDPTDTAARLAGEARALVVGLDVEAGVRLLGVGVSGLVDGAVRQLSLDDLGEPAWSELDSAVDAIRERFGSDAIGRASVAGRGRPGPGAKPWGPDPAG
jgi:DNA polymerase-4